MVLVRVLQGLVSVAGRIALAAIFLMSTLGYKIPNFNGAAQLMASQGIPAPRLMLVGAIVFLIVGSLSLIVGYRARFGAVLILVFLVLASYYFHNFWALSDPKARQEQMIHFMKNLSMMGAMLFIIANGPGAFSLDSRAAALKL
ncbi:MAG: DoxX family protein [Planctomycetaceae bacterium]|nr:DoxX family protein [Planctomycetaceae bacterium]